MRVLLSAAVLSLSLTALPALAQDYYTTATKFRNGNGYTPATIVAGSEEQFTFSLLAFTNEGERITNGVKALDWKATLVTGPKKPSDDDDEEDERYLDRRATTPRRPAAPTGPIAPRKEVIFSSRTCPALVERMQALKPLTTFEFNPPSIEGNRDGPNGRKQEGFDLWIRIGDAELDKGAATADSNLARWYTQTLAAISACPSTPAPKP